MESWHAILMSAGTAALTGLTIYFLTKWDRKSEAKSEKDKWVGSVNSDLINFKDFIREIREDIREIRQSINGIFRGLGTKTIRATSPFQLTDIGEKVAVEIGAVEWAEKQAEEVSAKVEGKSAYQIQEFCMQYCVSRFHPDQDFLFRLEQSAFSNGVDLRSVKEVLAVSLRDRLLKMSDE